MSRARLSLYAILVAAPAAACDEAFVPRSDPPPEAESIPVRMEATIDGRRVDASIEAGFEVALIEVNKGGIQLSATFRGRTDDAEAPAAISPNVRLDVLGSVAGNELPPGVEFTRYDAFSGAIYWIAPGQTVHLWLGLYHVAQGQYVFGPFPISVRRRSHEGDTRE